MRRAMERCNAARPETIQSNGQLFFAVEEMSYSEPFAAAYGNEDAVFSNGQVFCFQTGASSEQ